MQFTGILTLLFLISFSATAGTFIETFDGRDIEEWRELVQVNNPPGLWEIANGELEVVNREESLHFFTTGDDTWEDYTVEFDVKPIKKHGIGGIAIAARVKESWLVYCAVRDIVVLMGDKPPVHEARIDCLTGDLHGVEFILLYTEPHALLRLNKWARMKLSVSGENLSFWVDDKKIAETGDAFVLVVEGQEIKWKVSKLAARFEKGGAGFGLSNYTARFDNITVTGDSIPIKGGLAVTPDGKLATMWGDLKRF